MSCIKTNRWEYFLSEVNALGAQRVGVASSNQQKKCSFLCRRAMQKRWRNCSQVSFSCYTLLTLILGLKDFLSTDLHAHPSSILCFFLVFSCGFWRRMPYLSSLDSMPDILVMCYVEFTRYSGSQNQTLLLGIMQQVLPQG